MTTIKDSRVLRPVLLTARFWYYLVVQSPAIWGCVRSRQRKPWRTVFADVLALWAHWRMFPFHYFRYRLYEGRGQTRADLREYIPEFYFYHVFLPKLHDPAYTALLQNKIMLHKMLAMKRVPTPNVLMWTEGGGLFDATCSPLDPARAEGALQPCTRVFVKPAGGMGGEGIRVFTRTAAGVLENGNGDVLDSPYLGRLCSEGDFVVQEGLQQVEELNRLHPRSVNTLRILTRTEGPAVCPLVAILRMGRGGTMVDNSAQGGLSCEVDLDSWRLRGPAHSEHPVADYAEHPDTGLPFTQELPLKDAVRGLLESAASLFPKSRLLGWDVALTVSGPVVIEVNVHAGIDHLQITCQRGLKHDLGIER